MILFIKKVWVRKKKKKLTSISFLKQFLAWNGCFWLFTKIKKGSRTGFWCIIYAWFFHKNVPYLILYQCHIFFPSSDIKQSVLLSPYLDNCWRDKFKIYLESCSKGMADREKIEGKLEIQKFEYLENEKRFLDEIKSIFQSYLRAVKKLFISGD